MLKKEVNSRNGFLTKSMMRFICFKNVVGLLIIILVTPSCRQGIPPIPKEIPETPVSIARFDQDFFAMDTTQLDAELDRLAGRYGYFLPAYLTAILGIDPSNPQAEAAILAFLQSYAPVQQRAATLAEAHESQWQQEMAEALRRMRYRVPGWQPDSPFVMTLFTGPMDAYERFSIGDYGDVRTENGVGVALQFHLGASDPVYDAGMESGALYAYQVRRFAPDMVVVNAVKNLLDDAFPYTAAARPMLEEMVEKGKRLYLLKEILPTTPDSLLTGYTGSQLEGCYANEAVIWQFFVQNDLLYSIEPSLKQQYLADGPKTPELGDASPGYIGLFTGWQIVKAYMAKNKNLPLPQLMEVPADRLFRESGYKPK